jgi:predicted phosphodiesterase
MRALLLTDTHYHYSNQNDKNVKAKLYEAKNENPEIVIHSGDAGSHDPECTKDFCLLLRSYFPNIPICIVNGNHSYWKIDDQPYSSVQEIEEYLKQVYKDNNIVYLQEENYINISNKIFITGLNGWYFNDPYTNDRKYIPQYYSGGRQWLLNQAEKRFATIINDCCQFKSKDFKNIVVTHFGFTREATDKDWKSYGNRFELEREYFGANPKWEDFMENMDYLIFGHSHIAYEGMSKNTKIINVGGTYEWMLYKILTI